MKSKSLLSEICFGFILSFNVLSANGQASFDMETGAVATGYNNVRISSTYRVSDRFGLKAGYRILEGGADNDEVYNFALFNYAAAGLLIYL
jgi:hypothetical protein